MGRKGGFGWVKRMLGSDRKARPLDLLLAESTRLSQSEQIELVRIARSGCPDARRDAIGKLVQANYPLCASIAKYYLRPGIDLEDLFQSGLIGIYEAVDRYDESSDAVFVTYLSYWMRCEIRKSLLRCRTITVPNHVEQRGHGIRRVIARARVDGSDEEAKKIAYSELGLPASERPSHTRETLWGIYRYVAHSEFVSYSLDRKITESFFRGESDDRFDREALLDSLSDLAEYHPLWFKVMRMRFFDDLQYKDIASELGITRTYAMTICSRAVDFLSSSYRRRTRCHAS